MIRSNALDLWIISKFNILPTDERFRRLQPETKALLFESCNTIATLEEIRVAYRKGLELKVDDKAKRRARALGINIEEAVEAIKEQRT